jgi:hypothetical protein
MLGLFANSRSSEETPMIIESYVDLCTAVCVLVDDRYQSAVGFTRAHVAHRWYGTYNRSGVTT